MPFEKLVQNLLVGDLLWVKLDLSALRVIPYSMVSGSLGGPGGVTDSGDIDSW